MMALESRSWWNKGERVCWRVGDRAVTGTVSDPRGDYSWVNADDSPFAILVDNHDLRKLPADRDPAIQALASLEPNE